MATTPSLPAGAKPAAGADPAAEADAAAEGAAEAEAEGLFGADEADCARAVEAMRLRPASPPASMGSKWEVRIGVESLQSYRRCWLVHFIT